MHNLKELNRKLILVFRLGPNYPGINLEVCLRETHMPFKGCTATGLLESIFRIIWTSNKTDIRDFLGCICVTDGLEIDHQAPFLGLGTLGDYIKHALRVRVHLQWNVAIEYLLQVTFRAVGEVVGVGKRVGFGTQHGSSSSTTLVARVV